MAYFMSDDACDVQHCVLQQVTWHLNS